MPRDIPVGNGKLLVTFDHQYQIRDFYFPHVGQENHAGAGPCRFGVHSDVPGTGKEQLSWTSDGSWIVRQRYLRDTLTTSVSLEHRGMKLAMYCNDVVDFHRNILIRKIKVKNLTSNERVVRIMHHQDFNMWGTKIGDTAYFDPELRSMVHYRGKRYISVTFYSQGEQRIDEYATGTSGFHGAEGTWRDAEDGHLQGNAIAQGAVDSTISHHVNLEPDGERTIYMAFTAAESREELIELHKWLVKMGPQGVIDRTGSYWRLWVGGTNINFGNLPAKVVELFKRSLLVLRTQIDNGGAIIAANDSDIMQFSRDTYSYMWPRDGALVADSLDLAGFPDVARGFYSFCQRVITDEGYFYHKYNPDGSPASSWHPWVMKGQRAMPIQEDETALVVWAMWRHYYRYRDIEFIRPLWVDVVQKAADFMCKYRDERTGLPLPSYDLWEERWGVHAFTVATVYGGLKAARNFAVCFGDRERAEKYAKAAGEIKAGAAKYLFSEKLDRFVRRLVPKDSPTPPTNATQNGDTPYAEKVPLSHDEAIGEFYEVDEVIDASLYSIFKFHLFEADDPRVVSTMTQVEQKLWVKTRVGGVARYENDYYHRISNDIAAVPGNPWFICTLWLADYFITRAQNAADLKLALPIFEWTAGHSLESGVLAEQVNPYTNEPISVSPLTWSHATVVSTAIKYLEKLESLQLCDTCHQPVYRLRRPGPVEVKSQATFDRLEAEFENVESRETMSPIGHFQRVDPRSKQPMKATLAIDIRDCIGCDVCVANCEPGVLKMVDGKALIDLRHLNKCDLNGQCVEVCPTDVVSLKLQPANDPNAAPTVLNNAEAELA
ncbi:MAG TPA: glycoside hydrolase family 15 protein [Tepidisphaeraceae bacterium]|jgi:oligosaccharide amylase|nr:glycoside hydrolase family 15 protein [Tepidisphaeraceae bacterium]